MPVASAGDARIGIAGLDDVLGGGLERARTFLVEGSPGTGKTTIAMQFLITGAALGERCLYVTLSETEDELRATGRAHGWDLAGIDVYELVPPENLLDEEQQQSLLYSSDLELGETTRRIFQAFEQVNPDVRPADRPVEVEEHRRRGEVQGKGGAGHRRDQFHAQLRRGLHVLVAAVMRVRQHHLRQHLLRLQIGQHRRQRGR